MLPYFRNCKEVLQIKEIDSAFGTTEVYKRMEVLAQRMATRLYNMKYAKERNRKKLQSESDEIVSVLEAYRKNINDALDALQRVTLEELTKTQQALDETLLTDIDSCAILYDTVYKCVLELTSKSRLNDYEAFINYHKCREKMLNAETLIKGLTNQPVSVKFHVDETIQHVLANTELLGKTTVTIPVPSPMYTVERVEQVRVRSVEDSISFHDAGLDHLPNGNVLVSDAQHQRLSLFDQSFSSLKHSVQIPGLSKTVIVLSDFEAAVAVNSRQCYEIYMIGIRGQQLKVKKKVQLGKGPYAGFAVKDEECYVSHAQGIDVYSLSGKGYREFWRGGSNGVAVSADGEKVYVLDRLSSALVTFDKQGKMLHCLQDADLMCTLDITLAPNGNVFICELISNQIVQVSASGKEILSVVSTEYGLDRPETVCFSRSAPEMFAGQFNGSLFVLKMKL